MTQHHSWHSVYYWTVDEREDGEEDSELERDARKELRKEADDWGDRIDETLVGFESQNAAKSFLKVLEKWASNGVIKRAGRLAKGGLGVALPETWGWEEGDLYAEQEEKRD